MIEMFKTEESINPPFMKEIFCQRAVTYNLRNNNEFLLPRLRTTSYGPETIKYRGQRLWLSLPQHIRNAQSINESKKESKSWNGADCTCRLYVQYYMYLQMFWSKVSVSSHIFNCRTVLFGFV